MAEYGASSIKVLKGLEAVRKRPGMYIGDTSDRGLHHLVYEVIDNSIDEAMAGHCDIITVTLDRLGYCTIEDNGRGIPVEIHSTEGISSATVALTILHAGGKFDGDTYKVSGGLHGVGVSVVNALSDDLTLTVNRGKVRYLQNFSEGIPTYDLYKDGPTRKRGTIIRFRPDATIFTEGIVFNKDTLLSRFKELAYLNKGLRIIFIDHREPDPELKTPYKVTLEFSGGLIEFVRDKSPAKLLFPPIAMNGKINDIEVEVAIVYNEGEKDTILSFVNNIRTRDGGSHETGFKTALFNSIKKYHLDRSSAREQHVRIGSDDSREGLTAIISVRVPDPQFEGQTKGKLGTTAANGATHKVVFNAMVKYMEENPISARLMVGKAILSARGRMAAKKAKDMVKNKDKYLTSTLPGKLADCRSKDPRIRELYLVEGDSAGGSAKQGRNNIFQAILPLKGKILNTEKAPIEKMLKSEEVKNIITALGCGIGETLDLSKLRYHKIIIMTDADVDGLHIQTLILTFFFRFYRELIDNGYIYIAQPPLYSLRKNKSKTLRYVKDDSELYSTLLEDGSLQMRGVDYNWIPYMKRIYLYRHSLDILKKRFGLEVLYQKMIEGGVSSLRTEGQRSIILKYISELGYDVISMVSNDKVFQLYIRTNSGLEEFTPELDILDNYHYSVAMTKFKEMGNRHHSIPMNVNPVQYLTEVIDIVKKGLYIQRYKGLGEMNPVQLWETTMDPVNRSLQRIIVGDDKSADAVFKLFMGDEVQPRKKYIEDHALDSSINI